MEHRCLDVAFFGLDNCYAKGNLWYTRCATIWLTNFPKTRCLENELCGRDRRENQAKTADRAGQDSHDMWDNFQPSWPTIDLRFEICCKLLNDLSQRRSAEWKTRVCSQKSADRETFSARRMRGCCQLPRRIRLKSVPAIKPHGWPKRRRLNFEWQAKQVGSPMVSTEFLRPFPRMGNYSNQLTQFRFVKFVLLLKYSVSLLIYILSTNVKLHFKLCPLIKPKLPLNVQLPTA